jgi:hypothetical protein
VNLIGLNFATNENGIPIYYLKENVKRADVVIYYPRNSMFVPPNGVQRDRDISNFSQDDERQRRYMYILYKELR